MELSDAAKKARREYKRQWSEKNREHLKEYQRNYQNEWRKKNKDKVRQYNKEYWERKAEQMQLKEG